MTFEFSSCFTLSMPPWSTETLTRYIPSVESLSRIRKPPNWMTCPSLVSNCSGSWASRPGTVVWEDVAVMLMRSLRWTYETGWGCRWRFQWTACTSRQSNPWLCIWVLQKHIDVYNFILKHSWTLLVVMKVVSGMLENYRSSHMMHVLVNFYFF